MITGVSGCTNRVCMMSTSSMARSSILTRFLSVCSKKYRLPSACIIPLPKHRDPTKGPDFPPGSIVLAVYPGTTALYRAVVANTPRKVSATAWATAHKNNNSETKHMCVVYRALGMCFLVPIRCCLPSFAPWLYGRTAQRE